MVYGITMFSPPIRCKPLDDTSFEPVVRNGKIYARGSCDDKGQVHAHQSVRVDDAHQHPAVQRPVRRSKGEEEAGSANLGDWIKANKSRLTGDIILISDTSIVANDIPSIVPGCGTGATWKWK